MIPGYRFVFREQEAVVLIQKFKFLGVSWSISWKILRLWNLTSCALLIEIQQVRCSLLRVFFFLFFSLSIFFHILYFFNKEDLNVLKSV